MQGDKKLNSFTRIRDRFLKNRSFLNQFQKIWEKEVLNYFPDSLDAFPKEWIAEISKYSEKDLYLLDGKQCYQHLPDGQFKNFVARCRELEKLPSVSFESSQYPSWAWNGVKGKKQHEINRLIPIIKQEVTNFDCHQLIDIGGGVGHLARLLSFYEGIPVISVDLNNQLQTKGKARADKYPLPNNHAKLQYYCCEFNHQFYHNHLPKFSLDDQRFGMVGLHTCGNLANDFLFNIENSKSHFGINLGCCYLKLEPDHHTNLSQIARQNPLKNTKYSLTLATRGHLKLSRTEFDFKLKVKKYRYLLHLLFLRNGIKGFVSVGDSPPRDYAKSFADYAKIKFEEAYKKKQIKTNIFQKLQVLTTNELNNFFTDKNQQDQFWNLFYCDLIRWQVGRILEIDIILDRALYAIEKGMESEVFQVFDEDISPRNIGLLYKKKGDIKSPS